MCVGILGFIVYGRKVGHKAIVQNITSNIVSLQEIHKQNFDEYYTSEKELSQSCLCDLDGYVVYFSQKELPKSLTSELENSDYPHLSADSYNIILYVPKKRKIISISNKGIRKRLLR